MTAPRRELTLLLSILMLGSLASCASGRADPASTALASLQGTWEERTPPDDSNAEVETTTITIEGNSLYFYKNEEFWWDTTFTLPTDREPPHLLATIHRPEKHAGDEIIAFYKVENGMLTLAGVRSPESYEPEWPTSVDSAESNMAGRYELRKLTSPRRASTASDRPRH